MPLPHVTSFDSLIVDCRAKDAAKIAHGNHSMENAVNILSSIIESYRNDPAAVHEGSRCTINRNGVTILINLSMPQPSSQERTALMVHFENAVEAMGADLASAELSKAIHTAGWPHRYCRCNGIPVTVELEYIL